VARSSTRLSRAASPAWSVPFRPWLLQVGNLFGPDTPGLARFGAGLGTIGATIFLVIWPLVGALVCAGAAGMRSRRDASGA